VTLGQRVRVLTRVQKRQPGPVPVRYPYPNPCGLPVPLLCTTLTAAVGHPEHLNPRIIVDVAEHVTVILVATDEPDGRDDALGRDREKLEYGTVLPADNDAPVDKGQRGLGRGLVSKRPEQQFVMDVPERQGGILRNGGESEVGNIEIKCNKPLRGR
jgi:hypothetical protein